MTGNDGALGAGVSCVAAAGLPGTCGTRLNAAATATPCPSWVRLTVFFRPKLAQPRLANDALSRAAMNVNRLLPVAGTGEGLALNRDWLAAMKAVWRLSMLAQKLAGVSACCPAARESPSPSSTSG